MLWGHLLENNSTVLEPIGNIFTQLNCEPNVLFWKSTTGNSTASRTWRLALLLARFSSIRVRAARSMDPLRMMHRPVRHRGFCDPRLWLLWRHQLLMEKDRRSLSVIERNKWIVKLRFPSPTRRTGFFPLILFFFLKKYFTGLLFAAFPFGWVLYVDSYCGPWETPCFLTGKIPIS